MNEILNKKYILNYVICFLLGIGVGLGIPRLLRQFRPPHPMEGEPFIEHFSKKFNLSEEQKSKARVIITGGVERMKTLRSEVGPRFRVIKEETKEELSKIMDPQQRVKLERFHERMKERRKRMREQMGFPPSDDFQKPQKNSKREL